MDMDGRTSCAKAERGHNDYLYIYIYICTYEKKNGFEFEIILYRTHTTVYLLLHNTHKHIQHFFKICHYNEITKYVICSEHVEKIQNQKNNDTVW